jgi:hypothetical protein
MDEPQYDSSKSKLELRQFYSEQVARVSFPPSSSHWPANEIFSSQATNSFQQGEYDIIAATLKHFARYENVPPFDEGMANP